MQQFFSLLSWRLFTAQHVSGVFPPIIRSSVTAVAASGFTFVSWCPARPRTQHDYHHGPPQRPLLDNTTFGRTPLDEGSARRTDLYLTTLHSVGLLWTRDRPVAETSTWHHTTFGRTPLDEGSARRRDLYLTTLHSVGLLWTRDRPVAQTSTWQDTTFTTDIRTSNSNKRAAPKFSRFWFSQRFQQARGTTAHITPAICHHLPHRTPAICHRLPHIYK